MASRLTQSIQEFNRLYQLYYSSYSTLSSLNKEGKLNEVAISFSGLSSRNAYRGFKSIGQSILQMPADPSLDIQEKICAILHNTRILRHRQKAFENALCPPPPPSLDSSQKPDFVRRATDRFFQEVQRGEVRFPREQKLYNIAHINEHRLICELIKEHPEQEEFTIIDFGFGEKMEWALALANALLNESFIGPESSRTRPPQVNILSLTPRPIKDRSIPMGNCKLHQFGSVQLGDLESQMKERGFILRNQVDCFVSYHFLRDQVDPLGDLLQTIPLISSSGYLLFNGFHVGIEGNAPASPSQLLLQLLTETNTRFLRMGTGNEGLGDDYILTPDEGKPAELPMQYSHVEELGNRGVIGSGRITHFKRLAPLPTVKPLYDEKAQKVLEKSQDPEWESQIYRELYLGDPALYHSFNEKHLLWDRDPRVFARIQIT